LTVAKAALDAKEYAAAREAAEEAIRLDAREAAYLLLADIEEAETGDQGRVRQYLAKALRAPRDPAWVADGVISSSWAPVSPITGRLDAFEWRMPMERLGQLIEPDADQKHPALAAPAVMPPPSVVDVDEDIETVEPAEAPAVVMTTTPLAEPVTARAAEEPAVAAPAEPASAGGPEDLPARLPDDPGVDPEEEREKSTRRFRLF
jgi:HemY protein